MTRVEQIMTSCAFTCRATDDAAVAAGMMWNYDCGCIAVVDDAGSVVGVVTDRDLCMAAYTRGLPLHEISVGSVMQSPVQTCRVGDGIDTVEALMAEHCVRRIPVVDALGRPVGMLSLTDLARHALRPGYEGEHRVQRFMRTFADICAPRASNARAA
jgi:CBS domain-containing protein